jgi:hypothetical protein
VFQEAELMYHLFDIDGGTPICGTSAELLSALSSQATRGCSETM